MKITDYSEKSLFFRLNQITRRLEESLLNDLIEFKLTFTEALCLIFIFVEDKEDIYLKDISEILGFKKSLVSHAITSLETKKYIVRKINQLDRRRYIFSLSSKGKRVIPNIFKSFDSIDNFIEAKLNLGSKSELEVILKKLS